MIDVIKESLEIDRIIRNILIEQSELESNRVLNATSVRGQDLSKLFKDKIYKSYELDDLVILFETVFRPNSNNNVVMEEEDTTITNYSAYYVKVLVYGNKSPYLINKLRSRLLSSTVSDKLYDSGILLEKVSNPEPMREWINETLWIRNDFTLEISCRESFEKVKPDYEFEKLSDLILKEMKE